MAIEVHPVGARSAPNRMVYHQAVSDKAATKIAPPAQTNARSRMLITP
jgi:hypothetical protein